MISDDDLAQLSKAILVVGVSIAGAIIAVAVAVSIAMEVLA